MEEHSLLKHWIRVFTSVPSGIREFLIITEKLSIEVSVIMLSFYFREYLLSADIKVKRDTTMITYVYNFHRHIVDIQAQRKNQIQCMTFYMGRFKNMLDKVKRIGY
ncbi:hypothetical protein XENOCAPTIV_030304 [Xenoophorus captivus]|uniref:Uncharacterized protein n=1 Tax=Xenoophorus captivus TaxID=1517983 RepID=A0ABV0Q6Z1_9TELE